MPVKKTPPESGPEEDDLMREIDFLILAAEQSGDSRDSIRLILATIRDINGRLRAISREVGGMRNDLHEQSASVSALPSVDQRLSNLEAKIEEGVGIDELVKQVRADWQRTRTFMIGLFAMGATFCILVVIVIVVVMFNLMGGVP